MVAVSHATYFLIYAELNGWLPCPLPFPESWCYHLLSLRAVLFIYIIVQGFSLLSWRIWTVTTAAEVVRRLRLEDTSTAAAMISDLIRGGSLQMVEGATLALSQI